MPGPVTSPTRDCQCPRARHEHGTLGAYQIDGCRCFRCRLNRAHAHQVYQAGGSWLEFDWRSAVGVARRLQALAAIGHTDRTVAARLGSPYGYVSRLRRGEMDRVTPATFEAVARVYDELWDKPYSGPYSRRTRALAARKGWLPPLAWDDDSIDDPDAAPQLCPETSGGMDEIMVERIISGDLYVRSDSRTPELVEAVRRLAAAHWADSRIGERIRMTTSGVQKLRERHGIPAGVESGRGYPSKIDSLRRGEDKAA